MASALHIEGIARLEAFLSAKDTQTLSAAESRINELSLEPGAHRSMKQTFNNMFILIVVSFGCRIFEVLGGLYSHKPANASGATAIGCSYSQAMCNWSQLGVCVE